MNDRSWAFIEWCVGILEIGLESEFRKDVHFQLFTRAALHSR